jgi:hypothetical protein
MNNGWLITERQLLIIEKNNFKFEHKRAKYTTLKKTLNNTNE